MTWNAMKRAAACAAAMAVAAASGVRAQEAPVPAQGTHLIESIRLAAEKYGQVLQPGATRPGPVIPADTRQAVQLTLDDVVKLALDRNLTIAVQRLSPSTFDYTIASINSAYKPTLTSLLGTQSTASPPTTSILGVPTGALGVTNGATTFSGGIVDNPRWGGGSLSISANNVKNTTNSTTALYNPDYTPTYAAQYTQPLLRGYAIDNNRQLLAVTKINRDISDIQLRATIGNTLSTVREAYWNYVYTVQAVDAAQQAVDLAQQLVQDNQTRMTVGVMSRLDVVVAQSQAAQARQGLVQAVSNRRTAEIALKQLIVSGTQDPNWNLRIDPVDRPEFVPEPIDLDAAIRRALSARTDLAQAKMALQANDTTFKFLKNQTLPQADLVARYGLAGIGGEKFQRASPAVGSPIVTSIPGGLGDAVSSLFANNYPQWSVQVNFSMPIGYNVATTAVAQAKIQMNQTAAQVSLIELQIATDVTNAVTTVQSGVEAVQAAQAALDLAQQTYEAEEAKLDVGLSTNYNVILDLNALNTVKNSYLQAVLSYRNALVELDRLQQTTLQSLNVTLLTTGTLVAPAAIGSAR